MTEQQEGKKELKWEVKGTPPFCLEKCGKLKSSHRKRGPLPSRSQTRGYHVYHAARRHKYRTKSQAPQKKKKRGGEGRTLTCNEYLATSNQSTCIRAKRKAKLLTFLRPSKEWTTPRIGGQLMGPAKTHGSSRVAPEDDSLI